jgi:hypothetical protein
MQLCHFLELSVPLSPGEIELIARETSFEVQQAVEKSKLKSKDVNKPLFHRQGHTYLVCDLLLKIESTLCLAT